MSAPGPGNRDGDLRPRDTQEPPAEETAERAAAPAKPAARESPSADLAADQGQSGAAGPPTGAPPGSTPSAPRPSASQPEVPAAGLSDSSAWRIPPAPDQPVGGSYSGQFPVQGPAPRPGGASIDPRVSGGVPVTPPDAGTYRSGAVPVQRDPRASGPLPAQRDPRLSGPLPTQSGQWDADARRSGQFAVPPSPADVYRSGAQQALPPASPYLTTRTGSFTPVAAPGAAVTGTGGRAVVAPSLGSMLTDRAALAFIGVAVLLVGAMVVYIAARYAHFPAQIAMHFGPAGPTAPDRIGDKRELWTIPFIAGIVLAADAALAWALYHYDRFAARLLTLGGALVGAIGWVVLLTLLHR